MRVWQFLAACLGFLWVALGAYTGHGLLDGQAALWFEKAHRYHIIHVLALFYLTLLPCFFSAVAWLWALGVLFFSGNLYLMSFFDWPLRYLVPVGGVLMLLGWALLIVFLGLQLRRS